MAEHSQPASGQLHDEARIGFYYTLAAFVLWGIFPLYLKLLTHINAVEVLAHRIIWSIPVALVFLLWAGRTADIARVVREPVKLALIALSAIFVSVNWGLYVWAISVERTVEAALGYYINPLLSIALGMVFLGERLNKIQIFAIFLTILAVMLMTWNAGAVPWVALILATSFAMYGLLKKTVDIGPTQSFLIEVIFLSVFAIPYLFYLFQGGNLQFSGTVEDTLLLMGAGPVTAIPLILFAFGARRLQLTTVGLMQYIAPSMIFIIGVFFFREPFNQWQLLAFILIWTAIALYSWTGIKQIRRRQSGHV